MFFGKKKNKHFQSLGLASMMGIHLVSGVIVGMAAGSALLHLAGMVVGHAVMQRHQLIAKVAGGLTAALGAFMLTRLV